MIPVQDLLLFAGAALLSQWLQPLVWSLWRAAGGE